MKFFEEDGRRLGHFKVDLETLLKDPDCAMSVMGQCAIVRCEMMYATNELSYTAFSPHFQPWPVHLEPPEYDVLVDTQSDGTTSFAKFVIKP